MTPLAKFNLALRALVETGVVAGLAYWGFHTGGTAVAKIALGLGAPLLGFGFWGAIDFHQAGRFAERARLVQELVVSGIAAAALYAAGQPVLGIALAVLSVLHHALVYVLGERLLPGKT